MALAQRGVRAPHASEGRKKRLYQSRSHSAIAGATMSAMSQSRPQRLPALLVSLIMACTPAPDSARRPATVASVATPAPIAAALSVPSAGPASPDSVPPPASVPRGDASLFRPGDIPREVRATCDSAVTMTRAAIGLTMRREEGDYFDHVHGMSRTGCRLTATGSSPTRSGWDVATP